VANTKSIRAPPLSESKLGQRKSALRELYSCARVCVYTQPQIVVVSYDFHTKKDGELEERAINATTRCVCVGKELKSELNSRFRN
jgi:hypothetical protein